MKLKPLKCSFFQLEIVYLAHHVLHRGILPSQGNVWAMQEFPIPKTYMQVRTFCGLAGHYRRFIKGFANIAHPLYDMLGKEVKMGPVDLPHKAQEAMDVLKGKVQSVPVLVFPDFDKPFLLETDASKEGLGVVLSQKQSYGWYHPIAFGSRSLTPAEKNYHSSKLEFLTLKWSMTEHFKEYLAYTPFVVQTDNNLLTYVLTMPNLDVTGHRWVGTLASFQFELKYQKGTDNRAADALSQVPISHSQQTVQSLLKGVIVGESNRGEAKANEGLLEEHERLSREAQVQAAKLELMHVVDWEQAQEVDVALAGCCKWLHLRKGMLPSRQDTLLKECLGAEAKTEQGKMFFCICNSLILNKGLMYINTTPKGKTEGVLAFIIPMAQCCMALNGVHQDASNQGQQQTLALAQERFWWPMMAEDCQAIVRGCPHYQAFKGEMPRAPLCPIRVYALLELVHLDYTSIKSTIELNKPPVVKNVLVMTDHFMRYALAVVTKDQTAKMVVKVFYEHFIAIFGVPTRLLSDRGANFMSALVEELCSAFGTQKCRTTAYHVQCNRQVEHFHQTLFHMIGKLSHDKKAQWDQHLPELLQAYNSTRSAMTSYLPHYLMFGRHPHLPVDYYFLMVSAYECSRHVPAYVMEVRRHFKEAYTEAHLQTNCKAEKQKRYYDQAMSTAQLVPGDVVLMKNDAYQEKWKVKDRWSETEYVVVCRVTDGVPAYEMKDEVGNVKTIHHNRLFLVATPKEAVMPLGAGMSISEENIQSTHAEHTSLEVESDLPERFLDGADTLSPSSRVLLRLVGGVLWPLPSVAPRPTIWRGIGAGDGAGSPSDEEVH